MHVDIVKQGSKLSLANMQCDCGYKHNTPSLDIYIKRGVADGCPDFAAQAGLGKHVLIVADSITYDIAASEISARLKGAGYACRECILPGGRIEPTDENARLVLSAAGGADFLLGVGSGVITDLTRRAAVLADIPFAVFGTAASMDAYTSVSSSMIINGMKVTVNGKAAKLLMFDPAVIASAPLNMHASGVGDMFAKYNVLVDWRMGEAVAGEIYCPLCAQLLTTALEMTSSNIREIANRTEKGAEALIEALILGGLTMLIVGETRPCSSLEHNISHFWEMSHMAYGTPAISHGMSAGLGLIYALLMHKTLRNADLSNIDRNKIKAARMTKQEKADDMRASYPPGVGDDIMAVNRYWYLEWPEQEQRIDRLAAYFETYRQDRANLPDYRDIISSYELLGAPTSASKAGLSVDFLKRTLHAAKDFRPRYNIGQALGELGMYEEAVERILDMEPSL